MAGMVSIDGRTDDFTYDATSGQLLRKRRPISSPPGPGDPPAPGFEGGPIVPPGTATDFKGGPQPTSLSADVPPTLGDMHANGLPNLSAPTAATPSAAGPSPMEQAAMTAMATPAAASTYGFDPASASPTTGVAGPTVAATSGASTPTVASPTASAPAAPATAGSTPNVGDQKTINGKLAVWNGSQWQVWDGSSWTAVDDTPTTGNGGGFQPDRATQIRQLYNQYLKRVPSQQEIDGWGSTSVADIATAMQGSPEYQSLQSGQSSPTMYNPGTLNWVKYELDLAKSSDDPNYWVGVMAKDPKVAAGDQSAIAYWINRIRHGDGNGLGNGTIPDGGSGGSDTSGGAGGGTDYTSGAMWDAIQRLLARGESPVDQNDPNIKAATGMFRAGTENALRTSRNTRAERAAAEGLNSGGAGSGSFDSALQSASEQEGRDVGQFSANAVLTEIQARRQDVINALNFAQGAQRMQLQQYLSLLNDQLARAQMAQQNSQFYDQFGYQMSNGQRNYDLDYARFLAGR